VRKLLVASQKSGVGKTTTSINVATAAALAGTRVLLLDADPLSSVAAMLQLGAHPNRRTLREAGLDLPGVLVCDVAPGLDVLSPYEDGHCSDADFDDLVRLIDAPQFAASYGCLIVDAPPFLGANPCQLVGACDGLIVVSRAEPLAHRTLPAFLELVQRSQGIRPVKTHGILLTLPDGESPGGRWERELRGRLGGRALPQVIPFDEEVTRAFEAQRIAVAASPECPAAVQYHRLAESLKLAADPLPLKKAAGAAPLLAAAAALLEPVGAGARSDAYGLPSVPKKPGRNALEEIPDDDLPTDVDLDLEPDMPSFSGMASVPAPSLTLPAFRPPASARIRIEPAPAAAEAKPARSAPKRPAGLAAVRPWLLGVGLAAAVGIGLRFIELPSFMLPIAVGLAVTAAVVLALRVILTAPEEAPRNAPNLASALAPTARKKDPPDLRKEPLARYPGPKRPAPSGPYRRPRNK
jgi:cellulose biosynthesis protein BcsQ